MKKCECDKHFLELLCNDSEDELYLYRMCYKCGKSWHVEINPYPRFSYNSGMITDDGKHFYHLDSDYTFWCITHERLDDLILTAEEERMIESIKPKKIKNTGSYREIYNYHKSENLLMKLKNMVRGL